MCATAVSLVACVCVGHQGGRGRVGSTNQAVVLVTVGTHRNGWLDQWEESARAFGWEYRILGMGMTWRGFRTKVELVCNFCAEQVLCA